MPDYSPTAITVDTADVPNSLRGQYDWNEAKPSILPGWQVVDIYRRSESSVWWKTLEPTRGQYDFAIFDTYLAAAEASAPPVTQGVVKLPNGRLGFRIQAFWPDNDFG